MSHDVRAFEPSDRDRCREILDSLPEWFAIASSNDRYISGLNPGSSAVILVDDEVFGFVSLTHTAESAVEIDVLALHFKARRQGLGSRLILWVEEFCREHQVKWLHVKTRGPSTPDPFFLDTRAFYTALGFDSLFESLTLWGPEDSALIMLKRVG
jgi:N-acetylglutamate synthase-like GNAT family acetyltransferase